MPKLFINIIKFCSNVSNLPFYYIHIVFNFILVKVFTIRIWFTGGQNDHIHSNDARNLKFATEVEQFV